MKTSEMPDWIAERVLLYSPRKSSERFTFFVRVYAPFVLIDGSVDFAFSPGTAGCIVQTSGLPKDVTETVYGADTLQALELACNVDDLLGRFRNEIDIFFPDGEPYFND